jgi:hypothetical protein
MLPDQSTSARDRSNPGVRIGELSVLRGFLVIEIGKGHRNGRFAGPTARLPYRAHSAGHRLHGRCCNGPVLAASNQSSENAVGPEVEAENDGHDQDHGHSHGGHQHGVHWHDHASADVDTHDDHESNALRLSNEALRNVGLIDKQIRKVELTTFWPAITVPAEVIGRAGRTQLQVAIISSLRK